MGKNWFLLSLFPKLSLSVSILARALVTFPAGQTENSPPDSVPNRRTETNGRKNVELRIIMINLSYFLTNLKRLSQYLVKVQNKKSVYVIKWSFQRQMFKIGLISSANKSIVLYEIGFFSLKNYNRNTIWIPRVPKLTKELPFSLHFYIKKFIFSISKSKILNNIDTKLFIDSLVLCFYNQINLVRYVQKKSLQLVTAWIMAKFNFHLIAQNNINFWFLQFWINLFAFFWGISHKNIETNLDELI